MGKEKQLVDIIQKASKNTTIDVAKEDMFLRKIPFDIWAKTGIISQEEYELIKAPIEEFGLDDPKKLIKWLVDLHFAGIESINEGIVLISNDLLTNEIQKIKSMKYKLSDFNENDNKSHWYKQYADDISDLLTNLEGKTNNYLNEIKRIDNLPRKLYFLKANFNKTKVTSSVKLGKAALEAYFESLIIYSVLANERGNNEVKKQVLDGAYKFIDGLGIDYFKAYDKDKSPFWNKNEMLKKVKDAQRLGDMINDYLIA